MSQPKLHGENRTKSADTIPPSTPQGPESNDQLVSPEYRDGPYPGDRDEQAHGEGSHVATRSTGVTLEGKIATKESTGEGHGPSVDDAGRDPLKKEGREKNEP